MAKVGDKIKMNGEVQRYTIQARDERYVIMTKPMNAKKSYIYCIADLEIKIRSTDDLIFGPLDDYNTKAGAKRNLEAIRKGDFGLSRIHEKMLEPEEIEQLTPPKN